MSLFLRQRAAPTTISVVLAVIVLTGLFGGTDLPVPQLRAGGAPIPLQLFLAAATPVLLVRGLSMAGLVELTAVRRVWTYDASLHVVTLGALVVAGGVLAVGFADQQLLSCSRNAVGLDGLAILSARVAGWTIGAVAPVLYAIAVSLLAREPAPGRVDWAWCLAEVDDAASWLTAVSLFGLACLVLRQASATARP